MAFTDWYVEGPSFGNCNCGYACPCQFEELPTNGTCDGFEVLEVTKGHFGDVDLTGIKAALLYSWPGPIFEGGGQMQVIIDPAADNAQRDAIERVFLGKRQRKRRPIGGCFGQCATPSMKHYFYRSIMTLILKSVPRRSRSAKFWPQLDNRFRPRMVEESIASGLIFPEALSLVSRKSAVPQQQQTQVSNST
jgi:hypothetical protein